MKGLKRRPLIVMITTLIIVVSWTAVCFAETQADVQENQGQLSIDLEAEYVGSDTPLDNDELFNRYVFISNDGDEDLICAIPYKPYVVQNEDNQQPYQLQPDIYPLQIHIYNRFYIL